MLKSLGYDFDVAFTSQLIRAIVTTDLLLDSMGIKDHVYVRRSWKLNERHYGALQGLKK